MERQELLETMLKDLLNAVEDSYGTAGLRKVVDRMKLANRAREHRAEIDELEAALERR